MEDGETTSRNADELRLFTAECQGRWGTSAGSCIFLVHPDVPRPWYVAYGHYGAYVRDFYAPNIHASPDGNMQSVAVYFQTSHAFDWKYILIGPSVEAIMNSELPVYGFTEVIENDRDSFGYLNIFGCIAIIENYLNRPEFA